MSIYSLRSLHWYHCIPCIPSLTRRNPDRSQVAPPAGDDPRRPRPAVTTPRQYASAVPLLGLPLRSVEEVYMEVRNIMGVEKYMSWH